MSEIRSHIPPLDTTSFDCVYKRHCAFDTSSSRTLKKSHTIARAPLVVMLVQNTELDKKTYCLTARAPIMF